MQDRLAGTVFLVFGLGPCLWKENTERGVGELPIFLEVRVTPGYFSGKFDNIAGLFLKSWMTLANYFQKVR
jgi:hypothetical protein